MQAFLLVALAIALVAVMFALQNIVPVTVTFLTWTFEGSLALVLFVALVAGALASFLASLPALVKGRWAATHLNRRIAALEAELEDRRRTIGQTPTRASESTGSRPHDGPPKTA